VALFHKEIAMTNRPTGFYAEYLEQLIKSRAAAGLPPADDIAPEEYWGERRKWHDEAMAALNQIEAERPH
jgi:hypothetical protein